MFASVYGMWSFYLLCLWLNISKAQEVIYGHEKFTEYHVGNMSLILTAPHGGSLNPSSIPSRDAGCWEKTLGKCYYRHSCPSGTVRDNVNCKVKIMADLYTQEMVLALAKEICLLTSGRCPHIVINNLARSKLDANREKDEAAFGVREAEQAWEEFMGFIHMAKSNMWSGLLLDFHGQSHPEQWIELGYLISKASLNYGNFSSFDSSIYSLAERQINMTFQSLLRGNQSLGKLIEDGNIKYVTVPSPSNPKPKSGNYYSGGYIVKTHGSQMTGEVDAIQIELPKWVRKGRERPKFAAVLARAIIHYYEYSVGH
ncbi:uncharacterized protein LOC143806213 isoform X1 [Ranitomeya variabilis]|uniref:uncharacterized protein LOC143806213 isoform X1 n=1 Tax=Ranitomeya variabilis TaxID=490064 RepID=UPI004056496C